MFTESLTHELRRRLEAGQSFAVYCLPDGQPALSCPGQLDLTPWPGSHLTPHPHADSTERSQYLQDIARVAASLCEGEKTVISRAICGSWLPQHDVVELASQLFEAFPRCYRTLIYTPETGGWLGASPELLYVRHGNSLRTMALAGTLPQGDTPWDAKNLEEHALVADHVEQCLQHCGMPYTRHLLDTLNYGPVKHLYTPFEATVPTRSQVAARSACRVAGEGNFEAAVEGKFEAAVDANIPAPNNTLHAFRSLMHPTPAVGGTPRDRALRQIAQVERHQRQLYAGLITLRPDADSEYCIVNLRCMHFDRQGYCIYAGGGITAHSDPATEWTETQAKASWFLGQLGIRN